MAYVGWVPTANGRLSFRHIGETRKRSFLRYANTIDDAHRRVILGVERRELSDLLFRRATELLSGRNGAFWFVMDGYTSEARVGNIDALEGTVRIFRPQRSKLLFGNQNFFSVLRRLHQHHIGLTKIADVERFARQSIATDVPPGDIEVAFVLFRDGEIRMQQPVFADADLAEMSEQFAEQRGVSFRQWAANQAYFFIRDFCHVHQHHRPEIDTIIILQDDDGDELKWRNHVLYSMHHYVIRIRRSLQRQDLYRGVGVLAYAKAFRGVYEARQGQAQTPNALKLTTFQEDAIEQSLRSRIDELNVIETDRDNRTDQAIAESVGYRNLFFLFYIGVLTVAITLLTPYVDEHKKVLNAIGDGLVQSSGLVVISLFAILCVTWVLTSPKFFDGSLYRHNFLWAKDIVALSLLKRKAVGLISTSLSIIILLAVFLLVRFR